MSTHIEEIEEGSFRSLAQKMSDKIEVKEAEIASWARTAKDLSAGAAGGIAQVLLGQSHYAYV